MRGSPCQVKGVFDEATSAKPLGDGREAVPLLSSIQQSSEFGIDQRRRECPEASLQAFQGAEVSYLRMEKIVFALLVAFRKLCPYFKAYPIVVMTDQPIRKTMNKIEAAGRLIQLAINWANLTSNIGLE